MTVGAAKAEVAKATAAATERMDLENIFLGIIG